MTWTATVIKHNQDGLTMDVEFVKPGYDPVVVGVLLPPIGVDLQQHLVQYAPIAAWEWIDQMSIQRDTPAIGTQVVAPVNIPVQDVLPEAMPDTVTTPTEIIFEV